MPLFCILIVLGAALLQGVISITPSTRLLLLSCEATLAWYDTMKITSNFCTNSCTKNNIDYIYLYADDVRYIDYLEGMSLFLSQCDKVCDRTFYITIKIIEEDDVREKINNCRMAVNLKYFRDRIHALLN